MLIVSAIMLFLSTVVWAVFFWERAKSYDNAFWMPDTGIVPRQFEGNDYWGLGARDGTDVLQLSEGREPSTVTTAHGWNQTLTLEAPKLQPGTEIDLATGDARIAYHAYLGRQFWNIKPGTAAGTLRVRSVSRACMEIAYEIDLMAIHSEHGFIQTMPVHLEGTTTAKPTKRSPDWRVVVGDSVQTGPVIDTIHLAAARDDPDAVAAFLAEGVDASIRDTSCFQEGWTPLHHAASGGHPKVVALLLAEGADVNAADPTGNTPLHGAAMRANTKVAELLLDAGAAVNATNTERRYGRTPLDVADNWSTDAHDGFADLLKARGGKRVAELQAVAP